MGSQDMPDNARAFQLIDPQTGTRFMVDWHAPGKPTAADVEEMLAAHRAANPAPPPQSDDPTVRAQEFVQALLDTGVDAPTQAAQLKSDPAVREALAAKGIDPAIYGKVIQSHLPPSPGAKVLRGAVDEIGGAAGALGSQLYEDSQTFGGPMVTAGRMIGGAALGLADGVSRVGGAVKDAWNDPSAGNLLNAASRAAALPLDVMGGSGQRAVDFAQQIDTPDGPDHEALGRMLATVGMAAAPAKAGAIGRTVRHPVQSAGSLRQFISERLPRTVDAPGPPAPPPPQPMPPFHGKPRPVRPPFADARRPPPPQAPRQLTEGMQLPRQPEPYSGPIAPTLPEHFVAQEAARVAAVRPDRMLPPASGEPFNLGPRPGGPAPGPTALTPPGASQSAVANPRFADALQRTLDARQLELLQAALRTRNLQ